MNYLKGIQLAGILIVILLISASNVSALIEKKNLESLTEEADSIVMGKVNYVDSYWENGRIFTDISITPYSNLKGENDSEITVKIPGGTVGDIIASVSDVPVFEDNEDVILFLDDRYFEKDNRFRIAGWFQGKYTIKNGKIQETGTTIDTFVNAIQNNMLVETDQDKIIETVAVPNIESISPNFGPVKAAKLGGAEAAADSTRLVVTGTNFGITMGSLQFWRISTIFKEADIEFWNNTQIIARVPGRVSSYFQPGGVGNVRVTTSGGANSNLANFYVTYSYGGGKWPGNSMVYFVNPNTGDTDGELDAVMAAASTWNSAGADFEFIYGGNSDKTGIGFDGENTILWTDYNTGSIATTWTYWNISDPNTIIENDLEFNDFNYDWDTNGTPAMMDVQSIATHELGHMLQLLDLYGTADSEKIMYGYGHPGIIKRTLHPDDIEGIKYIYGGLDVTKRPYTFTTTDNAMEITVDGISHYSPYSVSWSDGEMHHVHVPLDQLATWQTRYNFSHWSGISTSSSNSISIITGPSASGVYNANYDIQYYLTVNTDPPGLDDPAGEGWYNSGDIATPSVSDGVEGYYFDHWTGDANGTELSTVVLMNSPKTVIAVYKPIGGDWNPWDDDCDISNVEISLAVYYWSTNTPINGHIISNTEISLLVYQWASGDVCS